jgi:hypothetical protein
MGRSVGVSDPSIVPRFGGGLRRTRLTAAHLRLRKDKRKIMEETADKSRLVKAEQSWAD